MTIVAVERHELGPRLHVLGRRVHEWHAGVGIAATALLCVAAHAAELLAAALALVAAWLVAKDSRDLRPATRDIAAWSLGIHRLRDAPVPRARDRVPVLAGVATALVGALNIAAVMTGDLAARARAVLALTPAGEVRLAHVLALPGGLALLGVALPLARRRRRALHVALVLLGALGVVNLLRSFDAGIAVVCWALAALLWHSREAFWVHDPRRSPSVADAQERPRAAALVRRHGSDTLSAFKLRHDLARHFAPDGRALAGYRIEAGALLIAGDPVGPRDAIPALLDDVVAFARRHGLALAAVGASDEFARLGRRVGLRRLYLGDEAILPAGPMDLSGGAMKTLRKAVHRVERNGFTAELRRVGDLDRAAVADLDALSARWRDGTAERGFSMTHDALVDDLLPEASVVLARDAGGRVRGFLHFVPVFGRRAVSLAFMRRDRDTPNGLTDFLVVEAARLLGEHGVEELSLNFAAFGRWLRAPANRFERVAGALLRPADRWFQLERLMRFNAKFQPRWQPRYLLFAGATQLPRVALGALRAEGHLSVPSRRSP